MNLILNIMNTAFFAVALALVIAFMAGAVLASIVLTLDKKAS
ncbi:MAG: hypothetical protein KatS3mg023_3646 [Armatimonadota bacterium]|jgi:hypothetical protein|nr:MAG: hypothetical protein KatS3mg023_3646 [Armatimonadota bacterium]